MTDHWLSPLLIASARKVLVESNVDGVGHERGTLVQVSEDHIVLADSDRDTYIPMRHVAYVAVARDKEQQ